MFGYSTAFYQGYLFTVYGGTIRELNKAVRVRNCSFVRTNNLYDVYNFFLFFFYFATNLVFVYLLIICAIYLLLNFTDFYRNNQAYMLLSYHTD